MVQDVDSAIQWAIQNCVQYGGDPERVVLIAMSSGAHIGALLLARKASHELIVDNDQKKQTTLKSWKCSDIRGFIGLGGIYDADDVFMAHLNQKGVDYLLQYLIFGSTNAAR